MSPVFLAAFLCSLCVGQVFSIKCYVSNTKANLPKSTSLIQCNDDSQLEKLTGTKRAPDVTYDECYTIYPATGNVDTWVKGCGAQNSCGQMEETYKTQKIFGDRDPKCVKCNSDSCNSGDPKNGASKLSLLNAGVFVLAALAFLF